MLANGQTLRHKETNVLARLDPIPGETWAWEIGKKTAFITEDGTKFIGDINDYTNIKDELDRPYFRPPGEGQFIDESAKKYLVSEEELAKMRQKRLEAWEVEVLDRMKNGGPEPKVSIANGIKSTTYHPHSHDDAGKRVLSPFADGTHSQVFQDFFLERRKARPLYRDWYSFNKEFTDGPSVFRHTDGQIWMYDYMLKDLIVIEEGSIRIPNEVEEK